MTDKQIIKPRPICLYKDTCLDLKEKTRLCEDCIHHKNYWSELLEKDQAEKIKSLEQECEELKKEIKHYKQIAQYHGNLSVKYTNKSAKLKQNLTEIKEIAEKQCNICEALTPIDEYKDCKKCWQGIILQKISECEVENA